MIAFLVLPKPLSPFIDSTNELTISVSGVSIHPNTCYAILSPTAVRACMDNAWDRLEYASQVQASHYHSKHTSRPPNAGQLVFAILENYLFVRTMTMLQDNVWSFSR